MSTCASSIPPTLCLYRARPSARVGSYRCPYPLPRDVRCRHRTTRCVRAATSRNKIQKPQFEDILYQECGFLCLDFGVYLSASAISTTARPAYASTTLLSSFWYFSTAA
eukprot:1032494-Rhodomonas_salina.1